MQTFFHGHPFFSVKIILFRTKKLYFRSPFSFYINIMILNKAILPSFICSMAFALTACVGNAPSPETNPQSEPANAADISQPQAGTSSETDQMGDRDRSGSEPEVRVQDQTGPAERNNY